LVQSSLKEVDYFLLIYKQLSMTTNFVMLRTQRHGSGDFTVLELS